MLVFPATLKLCTQLKPEDPRSVRYESRCCETRKDRKHVDVCEVVEYVLNQELRLPIFSRNTRARIHQGIGRERIVGRGIFGEVCRPSVRVARVRAKQSSQVCGDRKAIISDQRRSEQGYVWNLVTGVSATGHTLRNLRVRVCGRHA